MAELINLRQMKKRRARDDKRARGAEAAAKSGRTGAERARAAAEAEAVTARHEGHRRIPAPVPPAVPEEDAAVGEDAALREDIGTPPSEAPSPKSP